MRFSLSWSRSNPVACAVDRLAPWGPVAPRGIWPGTSEKIPAPDTTSDFEGLAISEAKKLWKKYKKLVVVWSGGMDSSLLAAVLMSTKPARSVLSITTTTDVLESRGEVYEWLASKGCEFFPITSEYLNSVVASGGMPVTGIHADTLLCGDILQLNNLYENIWHMQIDSLFVHTSGLPYNVIQTDVALLEPLLANMPLERTSANICYWLDFTCAWHSDELSMMRLFDIAPPGKGYINFFGASAFQAWSQRPVEFKVGKTRETHKYIYANLLTKLTGLVPENLPTIPSPEFSQNARPVDLRSVEDDWTVNESF